jgi:hypothetical protein
MMGLYIPLVGLAAIGLDRLRSISQRKWLAPIVLALLVLPGTLLLAMTAFFGVFTQSELLFLTKNEAEGLAWIAAETPEDALVLSSPEMGQFIPAWTGRRVIYGHPFETVDAVRREEEVFAIFQDADPQTFADYLFLNEVDYVYFGPREASLRPDGLDEIPGLRRVMAIGGVSLYEVLK